MAQKGSPAFRKRLLLLAGLVLSALFLWLTLRRVMLGDVLHDLMHHAHEWYALPFLAAYGAFFWLKALRWQTLLTPVHSVTPRQVLPAIIIGYAGNLLIPLQLGEIVRTYVLGNQLRIPNSPIIATIALERMFDLVVIAGLFAGMLVTSSRTEFPSLRLASYATAVAALAALALLLLYVYRTQMFLDYCRRATRFLPAALHDYVMLQLERAGQGLGTFRSLRMILRTLILSVAMWGAMAVAVHLSIRALEIYASPTAAIVALVFTVIGFMLPSGPGYVGTVQLSFLLALTPYEVKQEAAVAASIFYHLLITVPPLLAALIAGARLGYTPWRLWRIAGGSSKITEPADEGVPGRDQAVSQPRL